MTRRVVVIGYGMAGARLAEDVRRHDPDGAAVELTVLGAEPRPAYNRVLLSTVLAGQLPADALALHADDWARRHGVRVRLGATAVALDRAGKRVLLADGESVGYDDVVLATGAAAWLPPITGLTGEDGAPAPGVSALRTLADCERVLAGARPGAPVAVLGGGLLGLETARGLAGLGCRVTVVHPTPHLLQRQLDPDAARVLRQALAGHGIEFRLGVPAAGYAPGDGLKLEDGTPVPAGLVVVSAGVRPESALAAAAGLAVDRGVLVDDALDTADPAVHAIGDCARHPGAPAGLVAPAWEQAAVLARRLTGADPAARYTGTPAVTRLKAQDVDLTALGEAHTPVDDPDAEVLRLEDPARGRYAKVVLRGDRVTGAILLGFPDAAATLTQLHDRGAPAPADRLALLLGRALPDAPAAASPAALPAGAVLCRCNSVRKSDLVAAWRAGAGDLPALAAETRATTGCGGCRDAVGGLLDWLAAAEPETSPTG